MRGRINGITLTHNLPTSKWANSSMFMCYVLSCFAVADGQVTFQVLMSYMTLRGPASSSSSRVPQVGPLSITSLVSHIV